MSDIIVNRVALASDLAHERLDEEWNPEWGSMFTESEDPAFSKYVPSAQAIFDKHYDMFDTIIERNIMHGQIRK